MKFVSFAYLTLFPLCLFSANASQASGSDILLEEIEKELGVPSGFELNHSANPKKDGDDLVILTIEQKQRNRDGTLGPHGTILIEGANPHKFSEFERRVEHIAEHPDNKTALRVDSDVRFAATIVPGEARGFYESDDYLLVIRAFKGRYDQNDALEQFILSLRERDLDLSDLFATVLRSRIELINTQEQEARSKRQRELETLIVNLDYKEVLELGPELIETLETDSRSKIYFHVDVSREAPKFEGFKFISAGRNGLEAYTKTGKHIGYLSALILADEGSLWLGRVTAIPQLLDHYLPILKEKAIIIPAKGNKIGDAFALLDLSNANDSANFSAIQELAEEGIETQLFLYSDSRKYYKKAFCSENPVKTIRKVEKNIHQYTQKLIERGESRWDAIEKAESRMSWPEEIADCDSWSHSRYKQLLTWLQISPPALMLPGIYLAGDRLSGAALRKVVQQELNFDTVIAETSDYEKNETQHQEFGSLGWYSAFARSNLGATEIIGTDLVGIDDEDFSVVHFKTNRKGFTYSVLGTSDGKMLVVFNHDS